MPQTANLAAGQKKGAAPRLRRSPKNYQAIEIYGYLSITRGGPVLADLRSSFIARGRPVVSVTSEVAASVSFQTAPPKAARPDPSQAGDSFAALLDSGTPTDTGNSGAASAAPQQSAAPRRDDAAANADNPRSRDNASADHAAGNNSDDRDAAANADTNTQAIQQSGAKSSGLKTGGAKSTEKPSSDKTSQADASTDPASAPQDTAAVTTPNADAIVIAVAIPVTIALTDTPAATPASGDA